MEAAFAAGDPPIGVSPAMHARALAWVPPGFAAFDTGRTAEEGGAADTAAEAAGTAPPDAQPAPNGSGHAPAPEAVTSNPDTPDGTPPAGDVPAGDAPGGDAASADDGNAGEPDPDPAVAGGPDGIAATGPIPPVPANGHDANPDPMEIPEFLRRVQ